MAKTAAQTRNRRTETPISSLRTAPNTSSMAAAALVSVDKPLTDMQKLFVHYWAEGDSIPNAMKRAGYNDQPSFGYRMQKMPNIQALYQKYKKQYEEAGQMTKKKVMDMHMEAFEMSKLMAEPATMVAAAREIGKLCGYYEPTKVNINMNVAGNVTMQSMEKLSDAELIKLIEEGVKPEAELELLTDESGGEDLE